MQREHTSGSDEGKPFEAYGTWAEGFLLDAYNELSADGIRLTDDSMQQARHFLTFVLPRILVFGDRISESLFQVDDELNDRARQLVLDAWHVQDYREMHARCTEYYGPLADKLFLGAVLVHGSAPLLRKAAPMIWVDQRAAEAARGYAFRHMYLQSLILTKQEANVVNSTSRFIDMNAVPLPYNLEQFHIITTEIPIEDFVRSYANNGDTGNSLATT